MLSTSFRCVAIKSPETSPLANCVPYTTKFPDGHCKRVLGNTMVYGTPDVLDENNQKLRRYEIAFGFLKMTGGLTPLNGTDNVIFRPPNGAPPAVVVKKTCLDLVDYMYCHSYYPQCRISSKHQSVCKEACETFNYDICKKEMELLNKFNVLAWQGNYGYSWDIIDCTDLPSQNQSYTGQSEPDCYYPSKIRGACYICKQTDRQQRDGQT